MNADEVVNLQGVLESIRINFTSHWEEVAYYVAPRARWFESTRLQGEKVNTRVFDSTAIQANNRFAAAMASLMTPQNQNWHKLGLPEGDYSQDTKEYLDELNRILFDFRYRAGAGFGNASNEVYLDEGAFGNGVLFIDNDLGNGPVYFSCGLEGMYWYTDQFRRISGVHRKFKATSKQLVEMFGEDDLTNEVIDDYKKSGLKQWEVIHAVHPNTEREPGRADFRGMAYTSTYVLMANKKIISQGGYRSMPYAIGRFLVASQEDYGRSVAMQALPDIKTLNQMSKTNLRAAHNVVEPPLLISEEGPIGGMKMYPGALNYGGIDTRGQDAAKPLLTGANIPVALEMEDQRRRAINDAFFVTMFQILSEQPQMTATEALLRAQEKGVLLGPVYSRMQAEFFGPMIERELDILDQMGVLPEPPQELMEIGGEFQIEYQSPLAKAQRAEDGIAILRTIEAAAPLMEIDPTVRFKLKTDETFDELADIYGAPAKLIRSEDEMAEIRQEEAEQQQTQQLLEAAPIAASAAKDLAQAQQAETMEPQPILGFNE